VTDEYTYPMRDGAPTGSPGQYDLASIIRYLKSSDPGAVTNAGQAYLRFARAYERITPKLAQAGHDLNEAWTGTDASAAQEQMRSLWASSHTIGTASRDFGTAVERHGSEYLSWYRTSMPLPKDDAEARSWMQGANERITETWSALPPTISTPLYAQRVEHGGLIGTAPSGGSGGSGLPGGSGGPPDSGTTGGLSAGPSSTGGPGSSGSPGAVTPTSGIGPLTDPTDQTAPSGHIHPGQQPVSAPGSPGIGHHANQGTDLSGVQPPGRTPSDGELVLPTAPGSPATSPLPPGTGPQPPGTGGTMPAIPGGGGFGPPGRAGTGLPGGAAIGLPGSGSGFPRGGASAEIGDLRGGGANSSGLIRNGVIGQDRISPAAPTRASAFEEAAASRSGPAAMGPMTGVGGSAQNNRERERQSWAAEDPTLWNEDIEVSPSVLGATPKRTMREEGGMP
jgi:hypothetical protein